MAIDPPYRLDPFQNIINVHWRPELPTGFDGEHTGVSIGTVQGDLDSYGAHNDKDYYVYGSLAAPLYGWHFDDGFATKQWGPVLLTHNEGSINAEAKVLNISSGLTLRGSWYDEGGQNPPYGSWGVDFSDSSVSKIVSEKTVTMRVHHLDTFFVGLPSPYAAWLQCYVHWSS